MRYLLCSFFFLLSFTSSADLFEGRECLKTNFDIKLVRPLGLFGLFESKLDISKDKCNFILYLEKYKIQKTRWSIDICRGPVHLKRGKEPVEVLKRISGCQSNSSSDYCFAIKELILTLQDEGLVFAKGFREELSTEHGQVYCSYLLLKKYLERGEVLNLSSEEVFLFQKTKQKTTNEVSITPNKVEPKKVMPIIDLETTAENKDELEGISLEKSPQMFTC